MIVPVNILPRELIEQLPLSIKLKIDNNELEYLDTNLLSLNPNYEKIKQEIENYYQLYQIKQSEIFYQSITTSLNDNENIIRLNNNNNGSIVERDKIQLFKSAYDIKLTRGIYGLKLITNPKDFIIDQIKTFLSSGITSSIPFSPEINLDLAYYIKHIDLPTIKEELKQELETFIITLINETDNLDYDIVQLKDISIAKIEKDVYTTYQITVQLYFPRESNVNNRTYNLQFNFNIKQ